MPRAKFSPGLRPTGQILDEKYWKWTEKWEILSLLGSFVWFFFSAASLCLDIFFWLFFEELLVVFPRIQKKKKKATRAQRWELGWIFFGAGSTAAVAQVWFALYWLIPELWNAETHLHLYLKYFYFPWETWSEFWVFPALGWFGVEEDLAPPDSGGGSSSSTRFSGLPSCSSQSHNAHFTSKNGKSLYFLYYR